jgi:catechol 2,3-dioxygenase-like lactoylglutathione lyase family enzyme
MVMMPDLVKVQQIRSIKLTIANADRAKEFYTRALGFEAIAETMMREQSTDRTGASEADIRVIRLQLGDEQIELVQYLNIGGNPIPDDSQSHDLWFQHLAIVVSDLDRAYAHLQSFYSEPTSTAPQTLPVSNPAAAGIRAFKFKDPDRHNLELIWFPPDKGQKKWHQPTNRLFLGIDHSAIAISDTEKSLHFYRDLLGMQISGGSSNRDTTQSRLDGLPNAEVQITALQPAQAGLGIELLDYLSPANGRPIPNYWQRHDITHVQIEFGVGDLERVLADLRQNEVQVVSVQWVETSDRDSLKPQGYLIKDPDGHAVLLRAD